MTYKSRTKIKKPSAPSLLCSSHHNPSFPIPSHFMVSPTLSAIAGAILSPILPQIALDKLINYLCDYLSKDHPSSSGEAAKLQQLQKEWEDLEDANQKLKTMQREAKRLFKKDTQNVTVVRLLKKLNNIGYEIQDLESDLEYMELQRKVEEINQDEAHTRQSKGPKRWFSFPWAKGQSSEKRRRLSSSESLKLPLVNASKHKERNEEADFSQRELLIDLGLIERCQEELSNPEWQMIRPPTPGEQDYIFERKHKERNEEAYFVP